MKFLVTNIAYDFSDSIDEPLSLEEQFEITNETLGVWEAEDEDDLLEEITACSGSVSYTHLTLPTTLSV